MSKTFIPEGYVSNLNLHETQIGIKTVKDVFQDLLAERLNLRRVSAPLFVTPESGLNDNLNGVERPVSFGVKEQNDASAVSIEETVNSEPEFDPCELGKLSDREKDVLKLLYAGKKRKEIAEELFISDNTVKKHISSMFSKLQVSSREELFSKLQIK